MIVGESTCRKSQSLGPTVLTEGVTGWAFHPEDAMMLS